MMNSGPKILVIRLADESTVRIPRSWTDADGARVEDEVCDHVFTADALRELVALINSLARRTSLDDAKREGVDDQHSAAAPT